VPVYDNTGDRVVDYIKDSNGNPVTSRLQAETLMSLAREGNGFYFQASLQGTETALLADALANLRKSTVAEERTRLFTQLYQYFLAPGILLFLLAWFLPESRTML
jgi:Ca-activated chloride channel family protein